MCRQLVIMQISNRQVLCHVGKLNKASSTLRVRQSSKTRDSRSFIYIYIYVICIIYIIYIYIICKKPVRCRNHIEKTKKIRDIYVEVARHITPSFIPVTVRRRPWFFSEQLHHSVAKYICSFGAMGSCTWHAILVTSGCYQRTCGIF